MPTRTNWRIWLIGIALIGAYTLAWVTATPSSLSLNAYDLAEWSNLHPQAQPALWQAAILRGQLLLIAALLALHRPQRLNSLAGLLFTAGMIALIIAQLPPVEFLRTQNDPNQQQQFALAATTTLSSIILAIAAPRLPRRWLTAVICALALVTTLAAYISSLDLMDSYPIATHIGIGGVMYCVIWLGLLLLSLNTKEPH